MKLVNFILWLATGAVVGWVASRIARLEHRPAHNPTAVIATPSCVDSKSL